MCAAVVCPQLPPVPLCECVCVCFCVCVRACAHACACAAAAFDMRVRLLQMCRRPIAVATSVESVCACACVRAQMVDTDPRCCSSRMMRTWVSVSLSLAFLGHFCECGCYKCAGGRVRMLHP